MTSYTERRHALVTARMRAADRFWASIGYACALAPPVGALAAPAIYLVRRRRSLFARSHAAQAANLAITWLLYALSAAVLGAMLALDSLSVAEHVVVPLLGAIWLGSVAGLVSAIVTARRGDFRPLPSWICARILR